MVAAARVTADSRFGRVPAVALRTEAVAVPRRSSCAPDPTRTLMNFGLH
jgi:hypothetical protein